MKKWALQITIVAATLFTAQAADASTAYTWTAQPNSGSHYDAQIAYSGDGTTLVEATAYNDAGNGPGYIYVSTNGGVTWTQTSAPAEYWQGIVSSTNGMDFAAFDVSDGLGVWYGGAGGYIYTSTNGGSAWTKQTGAGSEVWSGIAMSSNGSVIVADGTGDWYPCRSQSCGNTPGYIYISTNGGTTWTQNSAAGSGFWVQVTSSSDGTHFAVVANPQVAPYGDYIITSTNGGTSWTKQTGFGTLNGSSITGITSSSDGTKLAFTATSNDIYTSTDGGTTWEQDTSSGARFWGGITSSASGTVIAAVDYSPGYIYVSNDGGQTWTTQYSSSQSWFRITSSSDGTKLAATLFHGSTYTGSPVVTCSITLTPNPSAYSYSGTPVTLTWSSSNADDVYINNVGWVNPSGSTRVASQQTTDYSCYGYSASYGDGAWDTTNTTLTVTPPSIPTVTIAASSTSIYTNQSTNVTADFFAASGDTLTADNIDEPYGTGLGATTDPNASKTISFSTTTPGTDTFYAMATTDAYPSWAAYASTTVTVLAPPSCTKSWSCNGNTIVQTNTDCSTTNLSTCAAPQFCQAGSSQCLAPAISFNQSGNYTGNLQLMPNLLQSGETTQVHWNVSNAQSCTVAGSNGDSWTGLSSPTNGETSRHITGQTIYTLACTAYDSNPNATESETVNVTPVFEEL